MLPDVSHKKVLFVGERIVDVYHFGKLIGRPPKEPIICIELQGKEVFEGGVVAAAEHAKSFVKSVDFFSTKELTKERFVDENRYRKLFEIYSGNKYLVAEWPRFSDFDAVIVTDYGHGMMTESVIERLSREARYLAVNVQTNSGNFGFNLATKYHTVDYLCVDETEARLATLNQHGDIAESVEVLRGIARRVVVTLGRHGAIGWDEGLVLSEGLRDRVVDTMGAGDAFFSITACMAEETTLEEMLKIGNAAGALKAQSLGQKPVTKNDLVSYLSR